MTNKYYKLKEETEPSDITKKFAENKIGYQGWVKCQLSKCL